MTYKAREAFWGIALGDNCKLACLAKLAIAEAENHPPQRTWVGLTDEKVKKIAYNTAERKVAKDIEAKLKEKMIADPLMFFKFC